MPLFAVIFEDDPDCAAAARERFMRDHLAFLDRSATCIRSAGPLRDTVPGQPDGGLWIVEAADRTQVDALVREDPFWPTGLRRSVRILEWRQVFSDGRRI